MTSKPASAAVQTLPDKSSYAIIKKYKHFILTSCVN